MNTEMLDAVTAEDIAPLKIGPGCYRRDLPGPSGARMWIVDMEPGARWPYEDQHGEQGEQVWIVSGDLVEGERCFGPGTYLSFGPHSAHQPRTERGVRLFGINVRDKN
jgi:hypothetical protein